MREMDGHKLMEKFNMHKDVSIYTKQKAMKTLGEMLESRAISDG